LIDRHLQSQIGQMDDDEAATNTLTNFRQARQTIAKAHDVIGALNPATGDVDARQLGQLVDDGDKLTGNSATVANFGRAFGDVAGRSKGDPNPVTAFQANTAGASGPIGAVVNATGRALARRMVLSDDAQLALMQPRGKTLTRKAMDAVHANPAAFGALYEDGNNQ
jgi:hypothetical protein